MNESRPVYVYDTITNKLIAHHESTQRAKVRLMLCSGSKTSGIVDLRNNNGSRRRTYSKMLKLNVYLTSRPIDSKEVNSQHYR